MVRNRRPERARRGGSIGGEGGVGAARRGAHAPRAAALPIAPQPPPQTRKERGEPAGALSWFGRGATKEGFSGGFPFRKSDRLEKTDC